ncbi:mycofactocin-coupled SDR family oxidoreductase [Saccharopolyspora gloriosae]|uniref:mycofactocin-coupled SDR family oxidoreductase n=1 Tax=Saccharopolyspora gloriosae TaxID=455344 RepID=UPI001FB793E0|nr:mycofactocin-coupled SDR family oxidoreductase [Saccharopolyspora gloriosae]
MNAGMVSGKVAVVTGAARGQGRSHTLRLAEEGADVVAIDLCEPIDSLPYPMATPEDLDETAALAKGGRVVTVRADVRDDETLADGVAGAVEELGGRVDIAVANAAVSTIRPADGTPPERIWRDVVDINMTGVWHTVEACVPHMTAGGSIVLIGSTAGQKGLVGAPGTAATLAYTAAKHGVVGLMRAYAVGLAKSSIRVNVVHPTGVRTPMLDNPDFQSYFSENPADAAMLVNALPVKVVEPGDISEAVVWLASDAARYVTGTALPVDAGFGVL